MVNGKQKGAAYEREICRELSLWVSNGIQEDAFWRSAMSGGRATVAQRKGKRLAAQAGDISCVHPIGHAFANKFFVEIKFYKDLQFEGLVTETGNLINFWKEAKIQAKKYGKYPMLIAKQNRVPAMVCLGLGGATALALENRALLIAAKNNLRILPLYEFLRYAERP
jgi:hypothetical protein